MWCKVQECRGPNGERLRRAEWSQPITGDLTIANAQISFVATLETPDVDRRRQLLYPLFDVRVQTFAEGFVVVGYRVNANALPARECRQAWYCIPLLGGVA